MIFTQLFANSLIIGSIYGLVACGFALIYATNRFLHIAHGATVAIAAYSMYLLFAVLSIPFFLAFLLTLFFTAVFGWVIYRLVYLPMQKKNASTVVLLIASIALLILFENVIQLFFGANVTSLRYPTHGTMTILGASMTPLQTVIIILSFVLLGALYLFMKQTKIGRDMRAVADNKELASIVGINQQRIADYSFIIGSFLAGLAGILIGMEQNLQPGMGTGLMIHAFTGAVIGGITSVPGAIVGSYILGFAENYGIWFLPSGYKDAIAFGLLFLFLLFKPTGLFGIDKGVKDA